MNKQTILGIAVLVSAVVAGVAYAHDEDEHSKMTKITGKVESVKGAQVSVVPADGKPVAVRLTAKTKYVNAKGAATQADLKAGVRVRVTVMKNEQGLSAEEVLLDPPAAVYTCSMHPEIERSEPGKCPKCGMFLEPKS